MCDRFKLEKHTLCSQSHAVLYYQINPDLASHCLNVNMTATHLHRSTNFRKGPFKLRNAIGGVGVRLRLSRCYEDIRFNITRGRWMSNFQKTTVT